MERSPEKTNAVVLLLDFYGELLTDRQRQVAELYYGEDLSLAEVARIAGITRQGVRDSLLKSVELLKGYEAKLNLLARFREAEACIAALAEHLRKIGDGSDPAVSELLRRAEQAILE